MSTSDKGGFFDPYHAWLGIPQQEQPVNYYRLLGLQLFESDLQAIDSATEQRLAFLRTKATGPYAAFAEQLMREVTQARLVLLTPTKKILYDAQLKERLGTPASAARPVPPSRPNPVGESQPGQSPQIIRITPNRATVAAAARRKKRKRETALMLGTLAASAALILGGVAAYFLSRPAKNASPQAESQVQARANPAPQPPQRQPVNPARNAVDVAQADTPQADQVAPGQNGKEPAAPPPPGVGADRGLAGNADPFAGAGQVNMAAQAKAWLDKVKKATVIVTGQTRQGSGFFVTMPDGTSVVITNAHVVQDDWGFRIRLWDGRVFSVDQGAVYPEFDLAILLVKGQNLPEPLELRDGVPEVSEKVYAYGAPLGLAGTLTEGIVSSVRATEEIREVLESMDLDDQFDTPVRKADAQWIQTSAPISPGNSGGPLLDEDGKVVGVNTLGMPLIARAQNLNFSLASIEVLHHLDRPRFAALPSRPANAPPGWGPAPGNRPMPRPPDIASGKYPFETYTCPDIVLPSGRVFQGGAVRPPENWRQFLARNEVLVLKNGQLHFQPPGDDSDMYIYCEYDENDVRRCAVGVSEGLLHGPMVLFNEEGHPYVIANYSQGTLDGRCVLYDDQGYPTFFGEFRKNRKHGLFCGLQDGLPRWIEEWQADQLVEVVLIKWQNGQPTVILQQALTDPNDQAEARELTAKVSERITIIMTWEVELKVQARTAFTTFDKEFKQQSAAARSAAARRRTLDRYRARQAADAQARAQRMGQFRSGSQPMGSPETIRVRPDLKYAPPTRTVERSPNH